ncbi:hypothetical protein TARUN_6135 [Trichoderma arundinaceum]|uniref:Uncharacterized protein n=1 Tax=Trichoderma arundinaceum TaxID=490622 RepID=A0A395NJ47_TRIAR|nr:hypothetical protein TARUN_6135 [Trichoderma arundinaceum]
MASLCPDDPGPLKARLRGGSATRHTPDGDTKGPKEQGISEERLGNLGPRKSFSMARREQHHLVETAISGTMTSVLNMVLGSKRQTTGRQSTAEAGDDALLAGSACLGIRIPRSKCDALVKLKQTSSLAQPKV